MEWINPTYEIRNRRKKGQFSGVKFVELTPDELADSKVSKMKFYWNLPAGQQNSALINGKDEDGIVIPPDRFMFVGGFDPTNYAAGSEVIEGSKNGGYIMSMPDELADTRMRNTNTGILCCEYYDRSELPDEAFDDFLKMIIYYGAAVIVEGNASYVATRMLEEGMGRCVIVS